MSESLVSFLFHLSVYTGRFTERVFFFASLAYRGKGDLEEAFITEIFYGIFIVGTNPSAVHDLILLTCAPLVLVALQRPCIGRFYLEGTLTQHLHL